MNQEDIKIARLQAKLSQTELAQLMDVSPRTIGTWEHGRGRCSPYMLKRIELTLKMLPQKP